MTLRLMVLALLGAPVLPAIAATDSSSIASLKSEAQAMRPLFRSALATAFLAGVETLPEPEPRTIHCDSSRTRCWSATEFAALPETLKAALVPRVIDGHFYYRTRYGSPLAYGRPLEILAVAGLTDLKGKRILDFGYGTIGHLRLLAGLGADVHGVDVDPLLRALYATDAGPVTAGESRGSLTFHHGQWPALPALAEEVGANYDLIISKNTLKNGYIHPAEPVNPRMMVHLGVSDSVYVAALARTVKPNGWVLIYNLCPAPAPPGKPYIPWADGRSPFNRRLLESADFEVLAFDRDDSPAARALGHALGWDVNEPPMDLERDLFATYTLLRRRGR